MANVDSLAVRRSPAYKNIIIQLSPVVVVLVMQAAARILGPRLGVWGWVPLNLIYWTTALLFVFLGAGPKAVRGWLGPSRGKPIWPILAVGFGVLPAFFMFIPNVGLFLKPSIALSTLGFALINPIAEELYWRGLLLNAFPSFRPWMAGPALQTRRGADQNPAGGHLRHRPGTGARLLSIYRHPRPRIRRRGKSD